MIKELNEIREDKKNCIQNSGKTKRPGDSPGLFYASIHTTRKNIYRVCIVLLAKQTTFHFHLCQKKADMNIFHAFCSHISTV
jgi:hypothetical protein